MKYVALFACMLGSVVGVDAQPAHDIPAEISWQRDVLGQTRARITHEHEQLAKACWQQFAVNDCLSAVRKSRRAQLDPIHQKELALNAQERAWHMQQRDERLKNKGLESGVSNEQ
jgi:colicin import membrane protein